MTRCSMCNICLRKFKTVVNLMEFGVFSKFEIETGCRVKGWRRFATELGCSSNIEVETYFELLWI